GERPVSLPCVSYLFLSGGLGVASSNLAAPTIFYAGCGASCEPPQTCKVSPVINEARSDARNAIAPATSSGVPNRPSGVILRKPSANALFSSTIFLLNGVLRKLGATALTRMRSLPSCAASALVSPINPILLDV